MPPDGTRNGLPGLPPPPEGGIACWGDVIDWHHRLNRYAVASDLPGLPGLVAVGHLQGLACGPARLYLLIRTRKHTFFSAAATIVTGGRLETEGDLGDRLRLLAGFNFAAFVTALADHAPALRHGHKSHLRALVRAHRRERRGFEVAGLGEVVLYPLRLPTVLRDLGLDPTHPALGVRRDWMTVADLGRRARLMPTPAVFTAFLAEEDARARAALAASLGPDFVDTAAVAALGLATQYRQDSYHFYRGTDERAQVRRQAAAAYPMFARALSEIPALRRAVDGRKPLVPALARTLQVGEATVRCFQSFALRVVPDQAEYLLLFLEDLDGSLCPGRRPANPGDGPEADPWACFASLAQELNSLASFIGGREARREALRDLLRGFDGDWCGLFRAVGGERARPAVPLTRAPAPLPRAGGDDPLHPRRRAQEEDRIAAAIAWDNFRHLLRLPWNGEALRDAARAFAYAVCLPLAAHDGGKPEAYISPAALRLAEDVAVQAVMRGRTLAMIVEFSDRFHRSIGVLFPQASSLRAVQGASLAWSRPSPPLVAPGGLALVPLGSVQDLVEEGKALGNCLPLYAVPCAIEGHRVVSVRQGEQRLGALEIVRDVVGKAWHLRQVEGPANTPAPDEVAEAAQWYVATLNAPDAPPDLPADATAGTSDVLRALCGYDWRDAAALDIMWSLWARPGHPDGEGNRPPPVLPRAALRRGLDGVRRTAAFPALVATLAQPQ